MLISGIKTTLTFFWFAFKEEYEISHKANGVLLKHDCTKPIWNEMSYTIMNMVSDKLLKMS